MGLQEQVLRISRRVRFWVSIPILVIYSYLAYRIVRSVFEMTIWHPPNDVFGPFDGPAAMLGLAVLGVLGAFGLAGVVVAFFVPRIGILFAISGLSIMTAILAFPLLLFKYDPGFEFYPELPSTMELTGVWEDDYKRLYLDPNGWFELTEFRRSGGSIQSVSNGKWKIDDYKLILNDTMNGNRHEWEFTKSGGRYFITYYIPANTDAWSGYLGLMHVSDSTTLSK